MTQAQDQIKSKSNKSSSSHIVQLHPMIDKKVSIPDHVWSSLKQWEKKLKYYNEECGYMHKMLVWNNIRPSSIADKELLKRFDHLITEDYNQIVLSTEELEKEVVSALFEGEVEIKQFYTKMQKLETAFKEFSQEINFIKLQVLRILANNPRISIF